MLFKIKIIKLKSGKLFINTALLISQYLIRNVSDSAQHSRGFVIWMDFQASLSPQRKGHQKTKEWGPSVSAQHAPWFWSFSSRPYKLLILNCSLWEWGTIHAMDEVDTSLPDYIHQEWNSLNTFKDF